MVGRLPVQEALMADAEELRTITIVALREKKGPPIN